LNGLQKSGHFFGNFENSGIFFGLSEKVGWFLIGTLSKKFQNKFIETHSIQTMTTSQENPFLNDAIRLCLRKIPAGITEEELLLIPCVVQAINEKCATLHFYSAEIIGETSVVPSSTAIFTFKNNADLKNAITTFSTIVFNTGNPVKPQLELAPFRAPPDKTDPVRRAQAPIDEDPSFNEFKQHYEESTTIQYERSPNEQQNIPDIIELPPHFLDMLSSKVSKPSKQSKKKAQSDRFTYHA
jgi:hypothetical protein